MDTMKHQINTDPWQVFLTDIHRIMSVEMSKAALFHTLMFYITVL